MTLALFLLSFLEKHRHRIPVSAFSDNPEHASLPLYAPHAVQVSQQKNSVPRYDLNHHARSGQFKTSHALQASAYLGGVDRTLRRRAKVFFLWDLN